MLRSLPTTLRATPTPISILRQSSLPTIRLLSQTSTSTTTAIPSATSTTPSSPSIPQPSATSRRPDNSTTTAAYRQQPAPNRGPYFVARNFGNNFSVYHLRKRGGNLRQTVVKKVEGDARSLSRDLVAALGLPEKEVTVNSRTNHVTIKGFHEEKVKAWLAQRGF